MHPSATKKRRAGRPPQPAAAPKSMPETPSAITPREASAMTSETSMTPQTSSWGKLNSKQSFNILAQDLDRAFAFARLSPTEAPFLEQVREACWGEANRLGKKRDTAWPDALGCRINLTALADATGITRQQWSVAKRSLVASRILIEDADGVLSVNKNAGEWIHPRTGNPRLTPKLIEFCRSVQPGHPGAEQAKFEFTRERTNPRSRHQTTVITGPADLDGPRCNPDAHFHETRETPAPQVMRGFVEPHAPAALQAMHPSPAPIEERGRVLDSGELNRVGVEGNAPHPDSHLGGRKVPDGPTHGAVDEVRRFMAGFPEPSPKPVDQAGVDRFRAMMARRPGSSSLSGGGGTEAVRAASPPQISQANIDRARALMAKGYRMPTRSGGGGA